MSRIISVASSQAAGMSKSHGVWRHRCREDERYDFEQYMKHMPILSFERLQEQVKIVREMLPTLDGGG